MKLNRLVTVILIAVVAVLAIHLTSQVTRGARADVTEDSLYSLTEGSHQILERMRSEGVKPITIKLYFSLTVGKSLPRFIKEFIVYEDYVRTLLKEYERASGGKIRLQFIDPLPDSDEAQDAADYGLEGKPVNQHGDQFYFGLVFETLTGSKDVIEFLWPDRQEDIEYEISRRIHSLLWPSSKRIGVLSSLDVMPDDDPYMRQLMQAQGRRPPDPWVAMKLLQERYEVKKIEPDTDHISKDDYDLVLVVHPRNLPEKTLWALDEWVSTGGNALVFLDPFALDDQPPQNPQQPWAAMQYKPASNLSKLAQAWGVTRPEDAVAADLELGMRRQVSRTSGAEKVIVDMVIDQETRAKTLAQDNPITRGVNNLRFFLAGRLDIEPKPGVVVTPLVTTTAAGNSLEMKPGFPGREGLVFMDANDPAKLVDAFDPGDKPVVLACLISGKLGSAFPNGATFASYTPEPPAGLPPGIELPPPADAEMITKEAIPEDQRRESTVILFSDVDLISNQVAFQQSFLGPIAVNDNHKLLLNSVDYLFGAKELMNVRAKSSIRRPFVLFDQIEEKADAKTREREKQIRAELATFEEQVRSKQSELTQRNAALFQKKLQDEVDGLNERIKEANRELRQIRNTKRAALENEEASVRFSIMGLMPSLVFIMGMTLFIRRKSRERKSRRG